MRTVLEVLGLAYDARRSQDDIAQSLALSQSTVSDDLRRFRASGLAWLLPGEASHRDRLLTITSMA